MIARIIQYFRDHELLMVVVLGYVLASLRFWPFYVGQTIFFGDNYSLLIPGKIFSAFWIRNGIIPLWNPLVFAGISWINDITQSIIYFSTVLFTLLDPAIAFNFTIVIHYVIAGVGMWFLAGSFVKKSWQRILALILWVFSTQLAGATNNLSTLQSLVWLPWITYLGFGVQKSFSKKICFGVVVLLQFLGGYPQHVIYSIFFAVLISFYDLLGDKKWPFRLKSWFVQWLVTALIVIAFSAAAWMPFAEGFVSSTRMTQSIEQAQVGSLHPGMMIKPFLPYFFDLPLVGMKWGPAWSGQPNVVFVITGFGMIVLIVSLLKWQKLDRWIKFYAIFTTVSLVFSLGKYLPYYALIQQLIPLFRVGRYPSMVMILTNVVVILWFVRYLPNINLSKKWRRLILILLGLLVVAAMVGLSLAGWRMDFLWHILNAVTKMRLEQSVFHTLVKDQIIIMVITANVIWVSLLTMINLVLWQRRQIFGLLVAITIEMWLATQGMFFFAANEIYPTWQEIDEKTSQYQQISPSYRLLTRNSNDPYTDYGSYWEALVVRQPFSDSFIDDTELWEHTNLKWLQQGLTPDWNMAYGVPIINGYTTLLPRDFTALWQKSSESRINFVDYIEIDNPLLKNWAVKYYLVDTWYPGIPDLTNYQQVSQDERLALYELPATLSRFRYEDGTPVEFGAYKETPNQIIMEFVAPNVRQLIMADRFDPNWQAELNGEPVEVNNWQGMRSIEIEPGLNQLTLSYRPIIFYVGLIVSLAALAIGSYFAYQTEKKARET